MTFRILNMAASATYGELPMASTWVDYYYNECVSRLLGLNTDGGWHNGDSYFQVNLRTLIEVPAFYSRISGFDFFSDLWYNNNAFYVIYQHPPFSKSAGQGSSHESKTKPNGTRVGYADALARECNNPWAAAYVRTILQKEPDIMEKTFLGKSGDLVSPIIFFLNLQYKHTLFFLLLYKTDMNKQLIMKKILHIKTAFIVLFFTILYTGCVKKTGYYDDGQNNIIGLICDITWAADPIYYEDGSTWQATYNFKRNGTYTRTNIETDKDGNEQKSNIYGQWSFSDPNFSTIYFGGTHYWDIDELTKNKFAFYDRSGEFGDPYMSREYIAFTPYKKSLSGM